MKNLLFKIIFLAWVVLWASFTIRGLVVKGALKEYRALLPMSLEEKHSYMAGKRLYDFVLSCKDTLPVGARYRLEGVEEGSIEKVRAAYYLYPLIESDKPDYVLVFGESKTHIEKIGRR